MKRDFNIIRQFLIVLEDYPRPYLADAVLLQTTYDYYNNRKNNTVNTVNAGSSMLDILDYHLVLLMQTSLVNVRDVKADTTEPKTYISLTWTGHDFLALSRNEQTWSEALALLSYIEHDPKYSGTASFDVLRDTLSKMQPKLDNPSNVIKQILGQHL